MSKNPTQPNPTTNQQTKSNKKKKRKTNKQKNPTPFDCQYRRTEQLNEHTQRSILREKQEERSNVCQAQSFQLPTAGRLCHPK